ncbi:TPA: hypothetical protein GFX97_04290 [Escherichia coli]|nr:hypothetical protein [Escherichia coli]HAH3571649.1 hypothetical protein [Escherichia coli]
MLQRGEYKPRDLHEIAFNNPNFFLRVVPRQAQLKAHNTSALKPTHEAGGRGGESTARWRWC